MKPTTIKQAWSKNPVSPVQALCVSLTAAFLFSAEAAFAQNIEKTVNLTPARDVVLVAAKETPRSAPAKPVQAQAVQQVQAPTAATSATTRKVNPETMKNADQQGSVRFSEWIKDNPEAARRRSQSLVSEGEIRTILAGALDRAINQSPLLRQSQAEQAAAMADVREAQGQRLPQIDIGGNSRPLAVGGKNEVGSNSQAVTMNMTTNVFDWGRTSNTIDSRKQLSAAADQKYLVDMETLARDVSTTVVELEKGRRINAIGQQYVERMSTLVSMLSEIVTSDRGRASELTQARARLMEAQASRDASQARVRDTEIRLRKLVGDAPVVLPANDLWALQAANLDRLLASANDHPALRQTEAEATAAELHAKSLRAGEKPQFNWVVSKSTGEDQLGREQPWQTMMTVSYPLFRGGSSRAAREAATLRASAEREKKAQQLLDLEFDTRTAEQDAKTLLARADLYRDLTTETDSVRKAFFEQWYHLGRRTLLDVLIAESDHNNNRINEVSNRFDGYEAVLKSYASAGQLSYWLRGGVNTQ